VLLSSLNAIADVFWQALNPEKVMLARVYVDHCVATQNNAKLEAVLPVVTAVAFKIQTAYNNLVDDIQAEEEARFLQDAAVEDENREEQKIDKEIVISELLKLAVNLDYTDEIGRRKMFQLVRESITITVPCVTCLEHLEQVT
jgi:condensin complex subunit 3